jgi:glucose/arabinose dehydrogenase
MKVYRIFAAIVFVSSAAQCQTLSTRIVSQDLNVPWEMIWGPDHFLWVTLKSGTVLRVNPQNGQRMAMLNLPDVTVVGESGLLGMALHPQFSQMPFVYLAYTYLATGNQLRLKLVRYRYEGGMLTAGQTLLENIPAGSIHNGCRLAFGPDGKLYMTTGDAGNTSLPQNLNSAAGKVLRLNDDGSRPEDNPFAAPSLVWTFGHRNAQGLCFGPGGRLYSSEHGPSSDDEINIIEPARNYGWPNVYGYCNDITELDFCQQNNVKEPIRAWTPTIAPAGMVYYSHSAIPEWQHSLLLVSLNSNGRDLRVLKLNEPDGDQIISETVYFDNVYGRLRAVCTSPDGRVFISTSNRDQYGTPGLNDDKIIEIMGTNTPPVLSEATFSPMPIPADNSTPYRYSIRIFDSFGPAGLASTTVDLSPLNGPPAAVLYDDGSNGDLVAGDGVYSRGGFTVPLNTSPGVKRLIATALDLGGLSTRDTLFVEVVSPDVWPGDANYDRVCDVKDFYLVAGSYGRSGPPRGQQGTQWQAYPPPAHWNTAAFYQGSLINHKFADANGDGVVNLFDLAATIVNRGLSR